MGCVLNFTANDYQHLAETVGKRQHGNERMEKSHRDAIKVDYRNQSSSKVLSILDYPGTPEYEAIAEILVGVMSGRMSDKEKEMLPVAFRKILRIAPDAIDMLRTSPSKNKHNSSARQHHFEIFAVAALIDEGFPTVNGKQLTINERSIDFGLKCSSRFNEPRDFGKFDADIKIRSSNPFTGDKTIGMDFKFAEKNKISYDRKMERQLDGIRDAIRNNRLDDFNYVSNQEFDKSFKEAVDRTNLNIAKDHYELNQNTFVQTGTNLPPGFFTERNEDFNAFIMEHPEIPQIDLCENVLFHGCD